MSNVRLTPIKLERLRAGILQVELSQRAGIRVARLSQLENAHYQPTASELERIANVLGVPVAALVPNGETMQGAA